jgi:uncharacterized iron-regulated membrane protein
LKRFRDVLFWCHLTGGVLSGIVIFIMSVTGVLLMYERQIMWWADMRSLETVRPSADAARLPIDDLVARAREAQGASPTSVTFYADANLPVLASFQGGKRLYLDPHQGTSLGQGSPGVRSFFGTVTDVHRWLAAPGDQRAVGRAITGAANLIFLFIVISGIYLWWPRKWTRKSLRAVTWFRAGQDSRARNFNWHNVFGFWSALPLVIVVASATVISYTWASNLAYRIVGEEPPAQQQQRPPAAQGAPVELSGLEALAAKARHQVDGWSSISMQVPQSAEGPVTFNVDKGNGGQPQLRSQLALDRNTGDITRWEPYSSQSAGRQLRSWLRFAHTGEVYGLIGQTIAGIASFGAAFLVFTGLSLAWRRFRTWRTARYQ